MKVKAYINSGLGIRVLMVFFAIDLLTFIGSYRYSIFPMLFAFSLWTTSLMGLLMVISGSHKHEGPGLKSISINREGFAMDNLGRINWDMVSGVNLSVFTVKITTGPRIRTQELDPKAAKHIRPMSGGGFVPELTRTVRFGLLTVYTSFNSKPAIELKCRLPFIAPQRVLKRIKRIGYGKGTGVSFSFRVHKDANRENTVLE